MRELCTSGSVGDWFRELTGRPDFSSVRFGPKAVAVPVIAEGLLLRLNAPKPSKANSPSRRTWLTTTRRIIGLMS